MDRLHEELASYVLCSKSFVSVAFASIRRTTRRGVIGEPDGGVGRFEAHAYHAQVMRTGSATSHSGRLFTVPTDDQKPPSPRVREAALLLDCKPFPLVRRLLSIRAEKPLARASKIVEGLDSPKFRAATARKYRITVSRRGCGHMDAHSSLFGLCMRGKRSFLTGNPVPNIGQETSFSPLLHTFIPLGGLQFADLENDVRHSCVQVGTCCSPGPCVFWNLKRAHCNVPPSSTCSITKAIFLIEIYRLMIASSPRRIYQCNFH